MVTKEWNTLLTALMFYTRIPVPGNILFSADELNRSTRYFPFMGFVVGIAGALVFWGSGFIFPHAVAVIFSMVATIYITGAFHEDGFADFCDGFGGGYTKSKILEIMKDSRLGTYGAIGLFLILMLKFQCLSLFSGIDYIKILIAAHVFSRLSPVVIIYSTSYVREDAESKVKPIGHKGSLKTLLIAVITGILSLMLMPFSLVFLLILLGISVSIFIVFRRYIIHKIGGYTGDVLGALQQLTEIGFYIGYIIYSKNFI